jgi:hypothetical protein
MYRNATSARGPLLDGPEAATRSEDSDGGGGATEGGLAAGVVPALSMLFSARTADTESIRAPTTLQEALPELP